jgi:hypothetical protein
MISLILASRVTEQRVTQSAGIIWAFSIQACGIEQMQRLVLILTQS